MKDWPEGREERQLTEELELPVLATEILHLSLYRSAFGETIEDLDDYRKVADELLEVAR